MFEEDYIDHDIWIINHEFKYFTENCNQKIFHAYPLFCKILLDIYEDVPEDQRDKLKWHPSKKIIEIVKKHDELQQN